MKKLIALVLVCMMALSTVAFATEFKDMPNDWSTAALEAAVKNGLLTGSGGYIKASDNMTRAEMATIMVRACGATKEVDISSFSDVNADDWFYTSMARAVAMGAFNGSDNKLNPNSPITRQEAFVVLSRVFGLDIGDVSDTAALNEFKDASQIADWAKTGVASIVKNGYVAGNEGYINPLNNISRAEFAVVMDRLIKYYIDDKAAAFPTDGNVMVRAKDYPLNSLATEKMVVVGDAVGDIEYSVLDGKIGDRLVLRGGSTVNVKGEYAKVIIAAPGIVANIDSNKIGHIHVCKDSKVQLATFVVGGETEAEEPETEETEAKPAVEPEAETEAETSAEAAETEENAE